MTEPLKQFYTYQELRDALIDIGAMATFSPLEPGPADILAAIAMVEGASFSHPNLSNYYEHGDVALAGQVNDEGETWGPSVTSWQIRTIDEHRGTGGMRDIEWLMQDVHNGALAAYTIAQRPRKYDAWTTYRNGRYKAYLQHFYPPPPGRYIVVSGDTWTRLDKRFGLPLGTMERWNPNRKILINEYLELPFVFLHDGTKVMKPEVAK